MNLPMLIKLASCRSGHTLSEAASLVKEYGQRHISLASEVLARSVKQIRCLTGNKVGIDFQISPLLKADIPAILEIEKQGQPEPWTAASFMEELDRLHSYVLVARLSEEYSESGESLSYPLRGIAGYICFWCVADEIQVLNLAVHENFRRRSVARGLLAAASVSAVKKTPGLLILKSARATSLLSDFMKVSGSGLSARGPIIMAL